MKNEKLKLSQLKIQSFVTEVNEDKSETIKGGTVPWICVIISVAESIHELGDGRSWWHCDSTGEGGGISDVVVPVPGGGEACQLKEIIVEG